jgi:Cu/Zn superoxide dismutase
LAGTHYKFDPAGDDDDEDNEIWPGFTTDGDGIGVSEVVVDHLARGDALAVVVHDPDADNAKMACADLTLDSDDTLTAKGSFASFAQADDADEDVAGSVEFVRSEDGTEITFSITGLGDEPEYMSHVHALPCDVADAGGHYKINPTETDTVEDNELWLDLGNTSDGEAEDSVSSEHRARLDAQSVVLHRMDEDTALKVACADLTVESYPPILVDGTGAVLEAAGALGLDDLQALGSLRRSLDGRTRVRVSALGLSPNTEYPVHVHSLPCSVSDGGPHYKIDTEEEDTVEENELWLTLSANADGEATAEASFEHTARADARAIVIHEAEDNERLVCIDLEP